MFQRQATRHGVLAAVAVALATIACGSNQELSPTGPSPIANSGLHSDIAGASAGIASVAGSSAKPESAKVELRGTVAGLLGTCPTVSFSLGGVSVQANSATKYEDGGCDDLEEGVTVKVKGTKGNDGVVTAKEIEVADDDAEDEDEDEDDDGAEHHAAKVELRGAIAQLRGVCPAVTFTLNRVHVKTSARTEFDGARCTELEDGTEVRVKGVRGGEGVVRASEVKARNAHEGEHDTVELRGTVADLKGACPQVSFHVGRAMVSTNSETGFEGTRCRDLKNGDYVKVSGRRIGNTSVLAESVEWERHDARPSEVRGAISGLTGSCPKVSFTVESTMVKANERTQYRGLTCSELAAWKKEVVVKGQLQADKSLLAARVAAVNEKH